jgi:hypothetical protein
MPLPIGPVERVKWRDDQLACEAGGRRKWLHGMTFMRKTCDMRREFSTESKKKLLRPCRKARALGL